MSINLLNLQADLYKADSTSRQNTLEQSADEDL